MTTVLVAVLSFVLAFVIWYKITRITIPNYKQRWLDAQEARYLKNIRIPKGYVMMTEAELNERALSYGNERFVLGFRAGKANLQYVIGDNGEIAIGDVHRTGHFIHLHTIDAENSVTSKQPEFALPANVTQLAPPLPQEPPEWEEHYG